MTFTKRSSTSKTGPSTTACQMKRRTASASYSSICCKGIEEPPQPKTGRRRHLMTKTKSSPRPSRCSRVLGYVAMPAI